MTVSHTGPRASPAEGRTPHPGPAGKPSLPRKVAPWVGIVWVTDGLLSKLLFCIGFFELRNKSETSVLWETLIKTRA